MLHSINARLVVLHDGVDELLGELPTIRETTHGVAALLNELKLLKQMTGNIRTELCSVLEKLTEVANLDQGIGQPAISMAELSTTQMVGIQSTLPALRQALERLTVSCLILTRNIRVRADAML
jgi:hypothetical protein